MAKDPAFLFYDGDAAKDVSHMNRLERGCYFDIIQAQRKFGRLTIDLIKKILGKDFETCWEQIKICLTYENDMFFIDWLENSINRRKAYCESRSKNRSGSKSKSNEKTYDEHMKTYVEHMVIENVNSSNSIFSEDKEIGSEKVSKIANEVWQDQHWKENMCIGLNLKINELQRWLAMFNSSIAGDNILDFNKKKYQKMSRGWISSQMAKGIKLEFLTEKEKAPKNGPTLKVLH